MKNHLCIRQAAQQEIAFKFKRCAVYLFHLELYGSVYFCSDEAEWRKFGMVVFEAVP